MLLILDEFIPVNKIVFSFLTFPTLPKELVNNGLHFVMEGGRGLKEGELV